MSMKHIVRAESGTAPHIRPSSSRNCTDGTVRRGRKSHIPHDSGRNGFYGYVHLFRRLLRKGKRSKLLFTLGSRAAPPSATALFTHLPTRLPTRDQRIGCIETLTPEFPRTNNSHQTNRWKTVEGAQTFTLSATRYVISIGTLLTTCVAQTIFHWIRNYPRSVITTAARRAFRGP